MCVIFFHNFFIIFCLYATICSLCYASDRDSIFWFFENEGRLRRDAPFGTIVQFDGPVRINSAVMSEADIVSLYISEPFLMRQHFNISPSSLLSAGQQFKLVLIRPLLPQHSSLDFLKFTIQAKIISNFNQKQQIMMHIEEKEIRINLFGNDNGHQNGAEKLASGMLRKHFKIKNDEKNCTIFTTEPIVFKANQQYLSSPSYKLTGPYSKSFHFFNEQNLTNNASLMLHYNGSGCAPPIANGKLHILATYLNPFGSSEAEIWSLESEEAKRKEESDGNRIHFIRKQFRVQFQSSLHALTPQLILLNEIEPLEMIFTENITLGLEGNGAEDILGIHPKTGALSLKDSDALVTLFQPNKESIEINALLYLNGSTIVDRAIISLWIGAKNWKRPAIDSKELIKFERSIYAFAVDPYNNNFDNGNNQIFIGKLETKPKFDEQNGDFDNIEIVIAEGGGGLFNFSGSKNSLAFNGPTSQYPRNYTLKLHLIADEFVDSTVVHVLIAGIGSEAPKFQKPFQRIMVSKHNNDFFTESQIDSKELFTLSADDTDPDAHLVYALEGINCRNLGGRMLTKSECKEAFSLSPNGTGQWVLSLLANEEQQMSEALMNISVRDEAHPLERQAYTLILLKFIQTLNATNEIENNSNFIEESDNLTDLVGKIGQNLTLHVFDSMPPNSVIYSFGFPKITGKGKELPTTLRYFLSSQRSKYFNIGKESGILSIALPLWNMTGHHQLTINVLINGKNRMQFFPILLEIASSIPKWPRMANYYEFDEENNFIHLCDGFANTTNSIEFLIPFNEGSSNVKEIKTDENGTLNFATIFDEQFSGNELSDFFIVFNKTQSAMSSIIPIHRELLPSFSPMPTPISSIQSSSPIRLPENSPIGTYILSVDFTSPMQISEFTIIPLNPKMNSTDFLGIERKTNSITLRTNRTLKGIDSEEPVEFLLKRNDIEIGQFSVQILATESLLQLAESSQWFPIGTVSAEMAMNAEARGCDPIKYLIERIGPIGNGDLEKIESAIRIDPLIGIISANPSLLDIPNVFEGIPLIIIVQSDQTERIRIQIRAVRQFLPKKPPPKFIGKSPILLEIKEAIPVGALLTTLKTYSREMDVGTYRLEGPDIDLLEIDPINGQLKMRKELDFEALNDRQLPLQMLAISEEKGGEKSEMELRLSIIDINDNSPEFKYPVYNFVVEKDASIGRELGKIEVEDADECTKNVSLHVMACDFHFGRFTRQIFPSNRIIKLDPSNGVLSLASSVDDSTGGHFRVHLEAEDDGGRRSKQNGTIWVVHSSDIVSILVNKSPVQLDSRHLAEYLQLLSLKTSLHPILYEIRYHIDADGQPIRQSSTLQLIFINQTHILTFEEAELALRDLDIDGMDGFEQNLFLPASSSMASKNRILSAEAANTSFQSSHLLSLSFLFLFLLATILSVLGVLICQHRRRYIAERHLADALKVIRQSSISKSETLDKSTTISPYYFLPPTQIADIWRRPLPPPPIFPSSSPPLLLHQQLHPPIPIIQQPTGTDGGSFHSQQNSDYYTVQEMKIAL